VYAFLRALFSSLLEWATAILPRKGQGVDAPGDPGLLRRAGGRIHRWLHKDDPGQREQPPADGTADAGQGLHQDR